MLQIGSGKLFTREAWTRNELRGVLYTNLRIPREKPIETAAGRLLPTSMLHGTGTVVYEFTELIEAHPSGKNFLVSHGMEPYLAEFATVVSFALNVTCAPDVDLAVRLISGRQSPAVTDSPKQLVRRVFDEEVWCQEHDSDHLVAFVQNLIGLQRKSYRAAMNAIRTYVTGLHRIADDLQLAYTLLVASIESLAQRFDAHSPEWNDYDESRREIIDAALEGAESNTAERVRTALLKIDQVSLGRRFRDFTLAHIHPSYFRDDAVGLVNPVGRAELPGTLREAYKLRSRHIHNLEQLPKALTLTAIPYRETMRIERATLLTIQGLARLAHHVITQFVSQQPKTTKEPYDYTLESHGVVQMPLAPEYWLGHTKGLSSSHGLSRLEGLLEQITPHLEGNPKLELVDLREMLREAAKILPAMKAHERRAFVATHFLFNRIVRPEDRAEIPEFEKLHSSELDPPSVESMLLHLVLGITPDWNLEQHEEVHRSYFDRRDRKTGFKVSRSLEAGLSLVLAERHRVGGNEARARQLISFAVENLPGHTALTNLEQTFDPNNPIMWRGVVISPVPKPQ